MAQIIQRGLELIRINTLKNTIEFSTNGGSTWKFRYGGAGTGNIYDLLDYGSEILACTSKGIYFSTNNGQSWHVRYMGAYCDILRQLISDGSNILSNTSKGLFISTDGGRSWRRK